MNLDILQMNPTDIDLEEMTGGQEKSLKAVSLEAQYLPASGVKPP